MKKVTSLSVSMLSRGYTFFEGVALAAAEEVAEAPPCVLASMVTPQSLSICDKRSLRVEAMKVVAALSKASEPALQSNQSLMLLLKVRFSAE